jgi:hypothetical protein
MSTATQPHKGRHLFALYSVQGSGQGTATAAVTGIGIVSPSVTSDTDLRTVYGLGTPNALFLKPGLNSVPFSLPIQSVQSSAFLLAVAQRSSGVLPWWTLGIGFAPDSGTPYGWQVQDCKIGSYDLSLEAGGLLSATVNGTGGLITALSAGAMSNIAADPLAWYEFSITRGGSAYDTVRSFRFSVNHNVDVQPTIRAKATSPSPGRSPGSSAAASISRRTRRPGWRWCWPAWTSPAAAHRTASPRRSPG